MKKVYRKYGVREYCFNNSKIRRLYHIYLHQSVFDKVLDILVFLAILFTVFEVVAHIFLHLDKNILVFIHSFSLIVLLIFGLELFREYALCENKRQFFKKHGIDFVLVSFLGVYFFTATYFGVARVNLFARLGNYAMKLKEYKVVYRVLSSRCSFLLARFYR